MSSRKRSSRAYDEEQESRRLLARFSLNIHVPSRGGFLLSFKSRVCHDEKDRLARRNVRNVLLHTLNLISSMRVRVEFSWSRPSIYLILLAVSVNVFFGAVRLINLLNIAFNYHYVPEVVDIVIFSPFADFLVWASSLLFIVSAILLVKTLNHLVFPRWLIFPYLFLFVSFAVFLVNDRVASAFAIPLGFVVVGSSAVFGNVFLPIRRAEAFLIASTGVVALLIPIELASLSSWMLNAVDHEVPFGPGLRWKFPWIDLQLFNVLYPLTAVLFLALLYSWIWIPGLKYALSRIGRSVNSGIHSIERLNNRHLAFGLVLSLAASIFISSYPYIHLPGSTLVGVDSLDYYDWLKEMMQEGPQLAFGTDRPIFNLLMYSVKCVTPLSPQDVVRIMPIVLAVCLSLAVFWFVKAGTGDSRLALLSSLFSSFSFQTTVSIFAYYLATWFAITEIFLLLVFLLKGLNKHSWRYLLVSAVIGMAVLLTSPYTWNVLMVILIAYVAWTLVRRAREKWDIAPLSILLAANGLFYVFYTMMPFGKGLGNSNVGVLQMGMSSVGIPSLSNLQNNLGIMVSMFMGGLFGNALMLVLAVAGMFSMINLAESSTKFNRIMLLWVAVPSIPLLFFSAGQVLFVYRLAYLIPLQILAAMGLQSILNRLKSAEHKHKLNKSHSCMLRMLLFTLIVLLFLNYALRSVDEAVIYGTAP
jgi:hypothetical protein